MNACQIVSIFALITVHCGCNHSLEMNNHNWIEFVNLSDQQVKKVVVKWNENEMVFDEVDIETKRIESITKPISSRTDIDTTFEICVFIDGVDGPFIHKSRIQVDENSQANIVFRFKSKNDMQVKVRKR